MKDELRIKQEEYYECIEEHIAIVWEVWDKVKDELNLDDEQYFTTDEAVTGHDTSRKGIEEFGAYRRVLFPVKYEDKPESHESRQRCFKYARNHHQKTNRHHWQYWIMWTPKESIALDMPTTDIIHMLCDWTAVSLQSNNVPSEWYKKEKSNMLLHQDTIKYIEERLSIFDKAYKTLIKQEENKND